MFTREDCFLPNNNFFNFKDKNLSIKYREWSKEARREQISVVMLLTATLYIIASQIERFIAPVDVLPFMLALHLFIIPLVLLFISYLAYKKKSCVYIAPLVMLAPIFATVGNISIVSQLEYPATYLTADYLTIFWVFTVSGLRLLHATLSAVIIFSISVFGIYIFSPLEINLFIMHIFWMVASFSFGFVGAYLLEKSNKDTFLTHEELLIMSTTDCLTGLQNRSKLNELLIEKIERFKRYSSQFAVAIIDIDFFKDVNDTYGHQVGDQVLVEMADVIRKEIRFTDDLIRFGGEEFILIYEEVSLDEAVDIAQNLRLKVESHNFGVVKKKTISIGLTLCNEDDNIMSIIKRADEALYKAKGSGRNCIKFL